MVKTGVVHEMDVSDVLEENYMPYTMSVIVSRALPEIDGLKPSHRKLLYTMYKMGLLKGNTTKCANITGATMQLNPHGDQAIYETLVRLTRGNESLLLPYIESKGNFGKVYSKNMQCAAPRYTEAKLAEICNEFFRDIEKNVVDFVPNYDNTTTEPLLFPVTFPSILANPNLGIAVGMASNICSFNLVELCTTTIEYIKDENVDLLKILKAPDFPTGGEIIYDKNTFKKIYETGKGTFYIRAKYKYDEQNNCIDVYEIPYTTTVEAIIDSVVNLVKENKIKEIVDIRNSTGLKGLSIKIDLKKNVNPDQLMTKLYKLTPLQSSFSCNFNIIVNGKPKVLGIRDILKEWLNFRLDCKRKQLQYDISVLSEKLQILKGLEKVLVDIDKAIEIVRNTKKEKDVIKNLMEYFEIDETQANYIADIKLRNLNEEYILNKIKDIGKTEKELNKLQGILASETKTKNEIIKELEEVIKKYGKPRKTSIIDEKKIEILEEDDLIENYNVRMFLTNEGYLKKVPLVSLRGSTKQKLKDNDFILQEIDATNISDILFFSDKYKVYKQKIYEIEDTKTSSWGSYLPSLLGLEEDEKIIYIACTENYTGSLLFFFENGKCARISLKSYETKNNRKQLLNAYNSSEKLVRIMFIPEGEDKDLVIHSSLDKILLFNTSQIGINSFRASGGVFVMKQKKDKKTNQLSKVVGVYNLDEVNITDCEYYRCNIPAIGKYLKKEDEVSQLTLWESTTPHL